MAMIKHWSFAILCIAIGSSLLPVDSKYCTMWICLWLQAMWSGVSPLLSLVIGSHIDEVPYHLQVIFAGSIVE